MKLYFVYGLTRFMLRDPHLRHVEYDPNAGDPPVARSFNFHSVQKNTN